MDKILSQKTFKVILPLILLILSAAAFWKSFYLGFYRDDWSIWTSQIYFWKILIGHNHPGTWIEDYLLFRVFGFNTYLWQGLGIFLRALAAFSVSLMVESITKSKKIGVLSGILFSVNVFAAETVTWLSVYIVSQAIILSCLAFYFWIEFTKSKKIIHIILSVILLIFAIVGDPGRSIFVIPMIVFWEGLNWWTSSKKELLKLVAIRLGVYIATIFILTRIILQFFFSSPIIISDYFKFIYQHLSSINNLFSSVGNLLISWADTSISISFNSTIIIFILLIATGMYWGLIKRRLLAASILFFATWVILLYLPDWIANTNYTAPIIDRYLAMSSVGYIAILAIFFVSIPVKYIGLILSLFFIYSNMVLVNKFTTFETSYRATSFTEPLWDQIYNDVPKGERNDIFMYLGNDYAKYTILDWSGPIPYGIRANITNYEDLPITTADRKLILDLLCKNGVRRPSIFDWIVQPNRIKLSHLHAWDLNQNVLKDVSSRERKYFEVEAQKIGCKLEN